SLPLCPSLSQKPIPLILMTLPTLKPFLGFIRRVATQRLSFTNPTSVQPTRHYHPGK
ncbi:hypothetical protein L0F63_004229, partial [Massospora cicadina]